MSRARISLIGTVTTLLVMVIALPASAHAVLTGTDPGDGALLDTPPQQLTFFFNEEIEAALAQIQILDGGGDRVDDGAPSSAEDGTAVTMAATGGADGGWTAAYRVVSADGHPIQGQISFTVSSGVEPEEGETEADGHSEDAEPIDPVTEDEPGPDPDDLAAADDDEVADEDAPAGQEEETAAVTEDDGTPLALLIGAGLFAGLTGLVMGRRKRRARASGTA